MKANGKQIQNLKQPSKVTNFEMVVLPPPIPMDVGTTTTYFHKKTRGTFEPLQYHKTWEIFGVKMGIYTNFLPLEEGM
jgi:hypothetical protein